jgi:hypothetical protein
MSADERRKEFLAKAKEADDQAVKAKDADLKDSWNRIAQSYRESASGERAISHDVGNVPSFS